jgi:hypothetical protein
VAFMEIATGTPTVATNLTFSGTVTVPPPAPAPTPQPATPAFTG